MFDRQAQRHLEEAELFLHFIALNPLALELVPGKLYYTQSQQGESRTVSIDDMPLMTYTASVLKNGVVTETFSPGEEPILISIADTIPGFMQGVVGMEEGEERTLYIHPDLAYGVHSWKLEPNQLLIIRVKLDRISP